MTIEPWSDAKRRCVSKGIGMIRKIARDGLMAFVLSLSLAAPVAAGPLEDGLAAAKRGDYAMALQLLRPLAESRDATAQYTLGLLYASGQGVQQDYVQAHKWFSLCLISSSRDSETYSSALDHRAEIEAKMTTEEITQAQALAAAWTPADPFGMGWQPHDAGIMRPHSSSGVRWPSKATSGPSTISDLSTAKAWACRRTMLSPKPGSVRRPTRASPWRKAISGSCTKGVSAFPGFCRGVEVVPKGR